ncbi:hypothetical protein HDU92_003409 [Lobulomyces angularis]|nr:hypothetical protein HDU92_003409 [Lobulomyces angularis]
MNSDWLCDHQPFQIWDGNLVNPCFEKVILNSALPASILLLSVLISLLCSSRNSYHRSRGYTPIASSSLNNEVRESPEHIESKKKNIFRLSLLSTVLLVAQLTLSIISYHKGTAKKLGNSDLIYYVSCICLWAFPLIISTLSTIGVLHKPTIVHFYPNFIFALLAQLFILRHLNDKAFAVAQIVISFLLIASELGQRFLDSYVEPLPADGDMTNRPLCLEENASLFSRAFFFWLTPMLRIGDRRPLEEADLWELSEIDRSKHVINRFHESKKISNSIYIRLLYVQMCCGVITAVLSFAGPYFLNKIVSWIEKPDDSLFGPWGLLISLFSCSVLKAINDGQMFFLGRRVGLRLRSILVGEIYSKALRRAMTAGAAIATEEVMEENPDAELTADDVKEEEKEKLLKEKVASEEPVKQQASQGKIVTLMSTDTENLRTFFSYLHDALIRLPLSVIISFVALYLLMGWSAFIGLGVLIVLAPLTAYVSKIANDIQTDLMEATDNRVNITNEVLQGIRIIKYFSWEPQFNERINKLREIELRKFVHNWLIWATFGLLSYGSGILVSISTFATFTLIQGERLSPSVAFTALSLLHRLSRELGFIPMEFTHILQMKVSMDRIRDYLAEVELEKYQGDIVRNEEELDTIGFKNAKFIYHGSVIDPALDTNTFQLQSLDVEFPIGKLSVICGATGAGKTSLILALLGELNRVNGECFLPDPRLHAFNNPDAETGLIPRSTSYVAQTAWMLNATVRDNILFGRPFNAKRYFEVIEACALTRDLETLDAGDMTEIGEKGVNVSGGQKQRISLARAAYSPSSIILLDDPLSAVDAPTARHLLYKCIKGPIMAGRTVILVSHAVGLVLPKSDFAVVIKNGTISDKGTPAELAEGDALMGILSEDVLARGSDAILEDLDTNSKEVNDLYEEKEPHTLEEKSKEIERKAQGKLVQDEEKASGSVQLGVYWSYFSAAGGIKFLIVFVLSYILMFGSDVNLAWWLKLWTDSAKKVGKDTVAATPALFVMPNTNQLSKSLFFSSLMSLPSNAVSSLSSNSSKLPASESDYADTVYYLKYYALFGFVVMLCQNINMVVQLYSGIKAARNLHKKLLETVLGAPMRFFETTPIGRVLNRFSRDIRGCDMEVMGALGFFCQTFFQIINIVIIVSFASPVFLLFVIPTLTLYRYVARSYLNTSRELKRLESVSRSPIFSQFSETLTGASTIRAYGHESRFMKLAESRVDENHRAFFYLWVSNRWLCLRTDIISACVVFASGFAIFYGNIGAGAAGLTLTYSLEFTEALLWVVRMHADMEMNMNSVERIQEYSCIEQEPPAIIENQRPPSNWPSAGEVEVKDLVIRYAPELPAVLKKISFSTKKFEKIGVVGRTGAGKSTLSLAFFRILPLSEGSISIDGIDISNIGLRDLRSRLTIIPQDPVLFSGTLRSNLDPIEEHDDAAIWAALRSVKFLESLQDNKDESQTLNDEVSVTEDNASIKSGSSRKSTTQISLDAQVTENGNNFSQGQRQLLCLARAILKRTKLIILDEATASVDNNTDTRIQETIREEFRESTLLCIAHRLRTVIDYDRILVLDRGEIAEFGTPHELIERGANGIFRSMCEESGEFTELCDLAKAKHQSLLASI